MLFRASRVATVVVALFVLGGSACGDSGGDDVAPADDRAARSLEGRDLCQLLPLSAAEEIVGVPMRHEEVPEPVLSTTPGLSERLEGTCWYAGALKPDAAGDTGLFEARVSLNHIASGDRARSAFAAFTRDGERIGRLGQKAAWAKVEGPIPQVLFVLLPSEDLLGVGVSGTDDDKSAAIAAAKTVMSRL